MVQKAKWTVIVYMAADNSQSFYDKAMADVKEMAKANFEPDQIKVVVYADAPAPWHAKCWEVKGGQVIELQDFERGRKSLIPFLVDFLETYAQSFRADYYLVVLWGHGEGIDWEDKVVGQPGFKGFGPGSKSALKIGELGKVLKGVEFETYLRIPPQNIVLGFDACLMSLLEVYYEIKNHVGWVVAANDEIPETGWPYTSILNKLKDSPSPADLAAQIVNESSNWYSKEVARSKVSFSACNLTNTHGDVVINDVIKKVESLGKSLDKLLAAAPVLGLKAITEARDFAKGYCERAYVDLNAFCAELQRLVRGRLDQEPPPPVEQGALEDLQGATEAVLTCFADEDNPFVIAYAFSDEHPHKEIAAARAVSICFPESKKLEGSLADLEINLDSYEELQFSKDTGWPQFLRTFWRS